MCVTLGDTFFRPEKYFKIFFLAETLFTTQITFYVQNLPDNEIWHIHLGS